jgi:hypothetical protein
MVIRLILGGLVLATLGAGAWSRPPLKDPALLNIGFVCRWDNRCISRQQKAMKAALRYVKKHGAVWKVEVCNRNSARNGTRKDWIGFNNCIRNPAIRPSRRR